MHKILVQRVTQQKIADVSLTRHKLIPVRIRGVPVCVQGVRQKNLHMGRHIMHNEVVRIRGLKYILWMLDALQAGLEPQP